MFIFAPDMTQELYNIIRTRLREMIDGTRFEGNVFFVGGCCRDEIMGKEIKDIDIAVSLPDGGILLAEWLQEKGYALPEMVIFQEYGIAKFRLADFPDEELEAVNTRKESYPDRLSRNPVTEYGTLEEDCLRRDLTINSLYYDITNGVFVDITGLGIDDIKNHVVRTTVDPDRVYDEDPLRILRCIRFATRFGWEIENDTLAAMKRQVSRMSILTQERIKDEFLRMLTSDHPVMAMEYLKDVGCMKYVIPELESAFGTVWEHTMKVLGLISSETDDLILRLAAILHDLGKTVNVEDKVSEILKRFKFDSDDIRYIRLLVRHHTDCKSWGPVCENMKDSSLRRLQYVCQNYDTFRALMMLIHAVNMALPPEYSMPHQVKIIISRSEQMLADGTDMFEFKPWLTGRQIMEILEIGPGPQVKKYQDFLLNLAFNDPLMPIETVIKNLKGY